MLLQNNILYMHLLSICNTIWRKWFTYWILWFQKIAKIYLCKYFNQRSVKWWGIAFWYIILMFLNSCSWSNVTNLAVLFCLIKIYSIFLVFFYWYHIYKKKEDVVCKWDNSCIVSSSNRTKFQYAIISFTFWHRFYFCVGIQTIPPLYYMYYQLHETFFY